MINRLSTSALIISIVAASINIFPLILLSWTINLILFIYTFFRKKIVKLDSSLSIFFIFCIFYLSYSFVIGVEIFDPEIYRRELKFFIPLSNCFSQKFLLADHPPPFDQVYQDLLAWKGCAYQPTCTTPHYVG